MSILEDPTTWRHRTARSGIPYRYVSASGSFSDEDATATEVYIIQSKFLLKFILESFPPPTEVLGMTFYGQKRAMPGLASLRTRTVAWEAHTEGLPSDPFQQDTGAPEGTYGGKLGDFTKITITYGTSSANDEEPDPENPRTFLEISANASGEFISSPTTGKAKWGSEDGDEVTDVDIPGGVVQPLTEWSVRWNQIPYTYFNDTLIATLRSKLGLVNDGDMKLLHEAPEDTMLFTGWSLRQQFTWRENKPGEAPVSLDLKFLEKNFEAANGVKVTHNKFFRPSTGNFETLLLNGQDKVFKSTNLDNIFQPNAS